MDVPKVMPNDPLGAVHPRGRGTGMGLDPASTTGGCVGARVRVGKLVGALVGTTEGTFTGSSVALELLAWSIEVTFTVGELEEVVGDGVMDGKGVTVGFGVMVGYGVIEGVRVLDGGNKLDGSAVVVGNCVGVLLLDA